jgi:hypothetical protein
MSEAIAPPDSGAKVPGPNAFRYHGTGSINNDQGYIYADTEKYALMADFIEVLAHGYTIDRAVRMLAHWATSPDKHKGLDNVVVDEPHPSYGRAVPSRKTFYVWASQNSEFKEAWDEAYSRGTEALEDHALDMAYAGDSKMVQFLLKARNPAKYANFGALAGGGFQIIIQQGDEDL